MLPLRRPLIQYQLCQVVEQEDVLIVQRQAIDTTTKSEVHSILLIVMTTCCIEDSMPLLHQFHQTRYYV